MLLGELVMKINKLLILVVIVALVVALSACSAKQSGNVDEITTPTESVTGATPTTAETQAIKETEKATEKIEPAVLNNTYTTKFSDVNMITYPKFTFNYPDNWEVVSEEVSADREIVTLQNNSGAKVVFSNFHFAKDFNFSSSHTMMGRVEVSKVDDSQFVPSYVQSTDYSSMGEFMVAQLKTTGEMNMQTDSDFTDVEKEASYTVLPLSEADTTKTVTGSFDGEFSFWYGAHVSFIGSDTEDTFTPEEQQEVIAILNSFRCE